MIIKKTIGILVALLLSSHLTFAQAQDLDEATKSLSEETKELIDKIK